MSYRRRTYPEVLDNLLTAIAGGVAAEAHPFPPPGGGTRHSLQQPPALEVVSVYGSRDGQPHLFRNGKDFELLADQQTLAWLEGAQLPDAGTLVSVSYLRRGTRPLLTDLQAGSVVRTLAESIGLEIARLYAQLETVYKAGFIDTAGGSALDKVVALLGIERVSGGRAVGELQFTRAPGAPGAITVPAGTRVMTESGDVEYETTASVTMTPAQTTLRVAARDLEPNEPLPADALRVLATPIAGVAAVTNPAPTAIAASDENDAELRTRAKSFLHGSERATLGALRHAVARQQISADVEEDEARPGHVEITPHVETLTPELQQRLLAAIEDARPAGVVVTLKGAEPPRKVDLELRLDSASGLTEQDVRAAHRAVRAKIEDYFKRLPARAAGSLNQLVGLALSVPEVKDLRLVSASVAGASVLDVAQGKLALEDFPTVLGELHLADPNLPTLLDVVVTYPEGQAPPDKAQIEPALGQALAYLNTLTAAELPADAPQGERDKRALRYGKLLRALPLPGKPAQSLQEFDAASPQPALPDETGVAPYAVKFALSQDSGLTRILTKAADPAYALAASERLSLAAVALEKRNA